MPESRNTSDSKDENVEACSGEGGADREQDAQDRTQQPQETTQQAESGVFSSDAKLSTPEEAVIVVEADAYSDTAESPSDNHSPETDPAGIRLGGIPMYPPGLECLLDSGQLVIHKDNFRLNEKVNETCVNRYEVVDETRRVLFLVEQIPVEEDELNSFRYSIYSRTKQEVISVYCPSSNICTCCGATWHCLHRCHLQAIIYAPPGVIAGFIKREHSYFVQDFEVLDPQEHAVLCLRGALNDLELYSADCEDELGRLSVHGWVGVMHEMRRSVKDWGVSYPVDLDVRVKACLLGAVFVVDWLNTKAGR